MTEQWHTYSEVAEALGIQVQSVRKRRQRYGWQSRTDNQTGRTEVLVDLDAMRKRKPSQPKPEAHQHSQTNWSKPRWRLPPSKNATAIWKNG